MSVTGHLPAVTLRHAPREDWTKPMTAGALARWVLWNKETLPGSIHDFIQRFNLVAV